MDRAYIYSIIAVGAIVLVCIALLLERLYLKKKIITLTKQNEILKRDNVHLMKHNGKLFDENQSLKKSLVRNPNIPDFKPW